MHVNSILYSSKEEEETYRSRICNLRKGVEPRCGPIDDVLVHSDWHLLDAVIEKSTPEQDRVPDGQSHHRDGQHHTSVLKIGVVRCYTLFKPFQDWSSAHS